MKKIFTASLLIIFSVTFCSAQYVTIPDTGFASFLRQNVPNCMNGNQLNTSCPDLLTDSSLYIDGSGIVYITGVEYFPDWASLTCDAAITLVPVLPSSLTYLTMSFSQ